MKIVSYDGAQTTLVMVADEMKPLKGFNLPVLLKTIGIKYGFLKIPTVEAARAPNVGAIFENGIAKIGDREITVSALNLYSDGLRVITTDTDDSNAVVDDLFVWLKETFQFREPTTEPLRIYQSDLVFRFDSDPDAALNGLAAFMQFIQKEMTPPNAKTKKPVQFNALFFGADPMGNGPSPEFTVARRHGVPWHLGLYFSKANLTTASHVKALEMLDGLIGR